MLGHEIAEPSCAEDDALADKIQQYWVAFAAHGVRAVQLVGR